MSSTPEMESRGVMQREMRRALACRTKQQKRNLANSWKQTYSEAMYLNLLALARNKEAARIVADSPTTNWKFEQK